MRGIHIKDNSPHPCTVELSILAKEDNYLDLPTLINNMNKIWYLIFDNILINFYFHFVYIYLCYYI